MGVKIAHTLSTEIASLSQSLRKKDDGLRLGANHYSARPVQQGAVGGQDVVPVGLERVLDVDLRRDPQPDPLGTHSVRHCRDHIDDEADPVVRRAAMFVGALVCRRGEELVGGGDISGSADAFRWRWEDSAHARETGRLLGGGGDRDRRLGQSRCAPRESAPPLLRVIRLVTIARGPGDERFRVLDEPSPTSCGRPLR
jgi:hypothetical protein